MLAPDHIVVESQQGIWRLSNKFRRDSELKMLVKR